MLKIHKNITKNITKENVKNKLFKMNLIIISIVFISNIIVFLVYFINNFTEKIQYSNDELVRQMANSYDLALNSAKNNVIKFLVQDSDLNSKIDSYSGDSYSKLDLSKKIDNILIENDVVSNVYLYIEKTNEVLFVSRNYSTFLKYDTFNEKEIFDDPLDALFCEYSVSRSKTSGNGIMSLCAKVPNTQHDIIAVNIDMEEAYSKLIGNNRDKSESLLVIFDENKEQIFPNPDIELTKDEIHRYNSGNVSLYNLQDMGLKFSLHFSKLYNGVFSPMLWVSIALILAAAAAVIVITRRILNAYLVPISKIIGEHADNNFKDMVLGHLEPTKEIFNVFFGEDVDVENAYFTVLLANTEYNDMAENDFLPENVKIVGFGTNADRGCYVVLFRESDKIEIQLKALCENIYSKLYGKKNNQNIISVSSVNVGYIKVPSLYTQAVSGMNYRIHTGLNIIYYNELNVSENNYKYDIKREHMLLSNLITGNFESCRIHLEKLFEDIKNYPYALDDEQIRNIVYRLQNSILKSIAGFPMPIRTNIENNLSEEVSLENIYAEILKLVTDICNEINKKDENDKYRLYNVIMEYIEKNFTRSDISNTLISDELNLNKGYLSKIIKECSGESLPEYINSKRIELAKQLLSSTDMPIEEISNNIGYNYSYYFIKRFKNKENMTPGEYRKMHRN